LSCLVLSCLVLSCLVLSCPVLFCLVLSCLVLSCRVVSCLVLSYCDCLVVVLSCLVTVLSIFVVLLFVLLVLSFAVLSYLVFPTFLLSCIFFFSVMFCRVFIVISCHDLVLACFHLFCAFACLVLSGRVLSYVSLPCRVLSSPVLPLIYFSLVLMFVLSCVCIALSCFVLLCSFLCLVFVFVFVLVLVLVFVEVTVCLYLIFQSSIMVPLRLQKGAFIRKSPSSF
jgi:hypothetical protein